MWQLRDWPYQQIQKHQTPLALRPVSWEVAEGAERNRQKERTRRFRDGTRKAPVQVQRWSPNSGSPCQQQRISVRTTWRLHTVSHFGAAHYFIVFHITIETKSTCTSRVSSSWTSPQLLGVQLHCGWCQCQIWTSRSTPTGTYITPCESLALLSLQSRPLIGRKSPDETC